MRPVSLVVLFILTVPGSLLAGDYSIDSPAEVLRKACMSEDYEACEWLSFKYLVGNEVNRHPERAVKMFEQICLKGHWHACGMFGIFFQQGEFVPRNMKRGIELTDMACANGEESFCDLVVPAARKAVPSAEESPAEDPDPPTISRAELRKVINRHRAHIKACYERSGAIERGKSGRVTVSFVIGKSGQVKSAKVVSTSLNDPDTEQCLLIRIRKWKFPSPGKDISVVFPFSFVHR